MAKIGGVIPTPLRGVTFTEEDLARSTDRATVRWTESAENISTREAIAILGDCSIGIGSWGTPWPNEELLAGYPRAEFVGPRRA